MEEKSVISQASEFRNVFEMEMLVRGQNCSKSICIEHRENRRNIIMKKMVWFVLVVGLILASTGCGPGYRTQQGAMVGAALGAWAGQDIGRNTESTLIGAALGGVAGAVVGDAMEQYEADQAYYNNAQPVYYGNYQYQQQQSPYQGPPRRY
jgi:uncharacterized protein YcfJ